jgi:FlaA1/EpsC-like NDP-sugar epimerase
MEKKLENIFRNKKILVTGGTGCIGSEIVKKLLTYKPYVVRIFSNDEDETFRLSQELSEKYNLRFLIGDIRDAIKTNVFGTQNVIEAALSNGVEKVINISTDKAVNPVNTMGATKLLAEKLNIDANFYKGFRKTIFSCVRFGNVLYSRGSVIPLFEEQIKQKKPITITDPDMTRFMMSISETINLVFKATIMAKGGEIFILKMPVVRLGDLTDVIIERYTQEHGDKKENIKKKCVGPRPGEKIFEELMTEAEAKMAFETEDMLIIPPQVELPDIKFGVSDYQNARHSKLNRYVSRDTKPLSKEGIKKLLSQ